MYTHEHELHFPASPLALDVRQSVRDVSAKRESARTRRSLSVRLLDGNGGVPGIIVQMVFHPGAARNHPVPPLRSGARPRAVVSTAGRKSNSGHGSETKRVSFKRAEQQQA